MKKIFKWIYSPSGNCPVQAEGWFLGYFFYFRSRHETSTIEFYNDKGDFYLKGKLKYDPEIKFYILKNTEGNPYGAGWLSKSECKYLIFKGCLKFAINRIKNILS